MTALATLTIQEFCEKAKTPHFPDELEKRFEEAFTQSTLSPQEKSSWEHSLPPLARLLEMFPIDGHILLEYPMPLGNRRADCVLIGADNDGRSHVVIVELKQWSQGNISFNDHNELTVQTHKPYTTEHPCDQAQVYMTALEHMLDFGDDEPTMYALAYLHNYEEAEEELLRSPSFAAILNNSLLLTRSIGQEAAKDLLGKLQKPSPILSKLCNPILRYSDSFIANFSNKLNCSALFKPTAEQEHTFKEILNSFSNTKQNSCIIIKGIVGTGKTVLAMMLVRYLMQMGANPKYHVVSAAIRDCLKELEIWSGGSASTHNLIIDEAHRLNTNALAGLFKNKHLLVFFIDDNQWLQPNENCRSADIAKLANAQGMQVIQHQLTTQLRCHGANHYIAWVDNFFNHGRLGKLESDALFEVQFVDTPQQMEDQLRKRAQGGNSTCRMVAGFCWKWKTRDLSHGNGTDIDINGWTARWNKVAAYAEWNRHPGFHTEVGAIYTVQGFEYDYVGVVIGPDLVLTINGLSVRPSNQVYSQLQEFLKRADLPPEQKRKQFAKAVRNIYYILLTRAKKGVFIYAVDPHLRNALKGSIEPPQAYAL